MIRRIRLDGFAMLLLLAVGLYSGLGLYSPAAANPFTGRQPETPAAPQIERAQGPLALEAKVSGRTLWKALNRLEEWKLIYRDNEGRKPDKSGAFVLRANVSHKGSGRVAEGIATPRLQTYDPGDLHLRAPRLRWSQPK